MKIRLEMPLLVLARELLSVLLIILCSKNIRGKTVKELPISFGSGIFKRECERGEREKAFCAHE